MMDFIEFKPVPREVARQSLAEVPRAGTTASTAVVSSDASKASEKARRETPADESGGLAGKAQIWLLSLPADIRPQALSQQFPRIANQLATLWQQPTRCEAYLKSLLVTDRPSRAGFPPEVALELCGLLDYYVEVLYPAPSDPWGTGF